MAAVASWMAEGDVCPGASFGVGCVEHGRPLVTPSRRPVYRLATNSSGKA